MRKTHLNYVLSGKMRVTFSSYESKGMVDIDIISTSDIFGIVCVDSKMNLFHSC